MFEDINWWDDSYVVFESRRSLLTGGLKERVASWPMLIHVPVGKMHINTFNWHFTKCVYLLSLITERVQIRLESCEKVANDLGVNWLFHMGLQVFRFSQYMAENVTKKSSNFEYLDLSLVRYDIAFSGITYAVHTCTLGRPFRIDFS